MIESIELINLDVENINFEDSEAMALGKEIRRIVPTNDKCLDSVNDYIEFERNFIKIKDSKAFF